jgi:hypothetical protein
MKKWLLALFLGIGLVTLGALYWLHGNVEGIVQRAIASYGSQMTGATVKVASVEIQSRNGRGVLHSLWVGNPKGFKTPYLFKVDTVELEVDLASLTQDVVLIRKIAVIAPEVIYEKGDSQTNIDAIQKNIAQYLGPSKKNEAGKKVIVQEFVIRGAKAQATAAFLGSKTVGAALPDLHLRDLGKAKGGITPGELGQEITNALEQRLTSVISFDSLAKSATSGLEKTKKAIMGLFK